LGFGVRGLGLGVRVWGVGFGFEAVSYLRLIDLCVSLNEEEKFGVQGLGETRTASSRASCAMARAVSRAITLSLQFISSS